MIETRSYDDHAAFQVFSSLDANDLIEAQLVRGSNATHLALFADWRAIQAGGVVSVIFRTSAARGSKPFGVLALVNIGQPGIAQAAFLARDHVKFKYEIAQVALRIRHNMPEFCVNNGINRVEARCWARHPSAARFLRSTGFQFEADLPGFGVTGTETFQQFAWISPTLKGV